jgi:hypothetical protein
MDWFNIQLNLRDKRILLLDIQNDSGLVYTYPQNSFNIDNFLESENNYNNLLISSTNTPNTFITYLDDAFSFRNLKCLSTGGLGLSPQFVYYESTVWLLKRKQKEQIPFFYSLQLLSVFVNVRWVLIQKQEKISINSVSEFFPSAV